MISIRTFSGCEWKGYVRVFWLELSLITGAGIFRALATAARVRLQLEAEVLWFGVAGLLELNHDVVAIAFGQFGFADEHIALPLEIECLLAVFRVSNHRHDLINNGSRLQRGIIERD